MTNENPRYLHESSEEFKAAVAKSKGRVVVLVHPYFREWAVAGKYEKALLGLQRARVPIIVLEEHSKVRKTAEKMKMHNAFFVRTRIEFPTPTRGWDSLHNELKRTGVKTILLGGMLAYRSHSEVGQWALQFKKYEAQLPRPPSYTILNGCVGGTYRRLIEAHGRAKIRLMPNLLFPERPH